MFYSRLVSLESQRSIPGGGDVTIPALTIIMFIKAALRAVPVNESWYVQAYPDVGRAVAEGKLQSAKQHFVEHGYFEGRLPYSIAVDEAFYLNLNPDVAASVAQGNYPSGQYHFDHYGCREGRIPFEGFDYFAETTPKQTSRLLGGRGMLFSRMRNRRSAKPFSQSSASSAAQY